MMCIFSFFSFLGPCIPAGHFVFTWIVQTLIIVHMALVVYGQCLWLCIYGYVYGCVFMAMCMDVCLWLCVYGYRFMGLYGRVSGCMCHNPIFTPGIFSGVGAQNRTAQTRPDQPNRDPSFQNDPRMLPRAPLPKFEEV